jgi:putative ABC transport system permease protein
MANSWSKSSPTAPAGAGRGCEIRSRLGKQGIGVVVTLYQDPERHWGRMFVEGVTLVLQIMALVSLFLSVVLVLNTTNALITQQTDQIGVIKAVGGRSSTRAQRSTWPGVGLRAGQRS